MYVAIYDLANAMQEICFLEFEIAYMHMVVFQPLLKHIAC